MRSSETSIIHLLERQAEQQPSAPAISVLTAEGVETTTWSEYRRLTELTAAGLLELGVVSGDTVAIFAGNCLEHYVADLAAVQCGAASVSLYATLADDQLAHVLKDANPSVIVVANKQLRERIRGALAGGQRPWLVNLDAVAETSPKPISDAVAPAQPNERGISWESLLETGARKLESHRSRLSDQASSDVKDCVATYVYTSGTTGASKGVALTHGNICWQLDSWERMGLFAPSYRAISYLPLAHIAERLWSLYFPLKAGGHVFCCSDPSQLGASLKLHRPSFFMGVPRIWEKLKDTVDQRLASETYRPRSADLARDRQTLTEAWTLRQTDAPLPSDLRMQALHAREGVLHDLRVELGLDKLVFGTSGAAPLGDSIKRFFGSIGVDITQAYGMTETTGIATWERGPGGSRDSVGTPLPGCDIKLAEDGEILIRCPGNTPGYRKVSNAQSGLYRGDWLASGDVGTIDDAGRLHIIDRKKEMIVNSSGKNISPVAIESRLSDEGFIDKAVAIGDQRPYIVALITVKQRELTDLAARFGISGEIAELVNHPEILEGAQRLINQCNAGLSRPEQVKRFTLIPDEWSNRTGEMTPTMKIRRQVVERKYASIIDAMYATSPSANPIPADLARQVRSGPNTEEV